MYFLPIAGIWGSRAMVDGLYAESTAVKATIFQSTRGITDERSGYLKLSQRELLITDRRPNAQTSCKNLNTYQNYYYLLNRGRYARSHGSSSGMDCMMPCQLWPWLIFRRVHGRLIRASTICNKFSVTELNRHTPELRHKSTQNGPYYNFLPN